MVKSGKAIFSRLNHIYIPSSKALKCTFLFSVLSCCTCLKSSIKKILLARVLLATSLYPSLCVHLDRACALLCDPNNWYRS